VEIHEGSIEVESDVHKGSTFRVWLPIYQEEPEVAQLEAQAVVS
jgi:signal transduction histidine kinase